MKECKAKMGIVKNIIDDTIKILNQCQSRLGFLFQDAAQYVAISSPNSRRDSTIIPFLTPQLNLRDNKELSEEVSGLALSSC